jgi:hypothetical protein
MRKLIFTGKIHPERTNVTLTVTTQELTDPEGYEIGILKVTVLCSQVTAELNTPLENIDVYTLRNSIQPIVEVLVDNFGFNVGCGYEVELIQVIDSLSEGPILFGVGIESLQNKYNEKEKLVERIRKVYSLCKGMEGAYLVRALGLFRRAIRSPFDSGLYCYMAIESIRNIYCLRKDLDPQKNRNQSWEALNHDLGVTKEFITENIKAHSDIVRHGGIQPFSEKDRVNLLESTWNILNLYIEKHGKSDC